MAHGTQNSQGTENGKKLIAKSEGTYRGFIIYELGERKFGILVKGKVIDGFQTLGEVKGFIDSYYAQFACVYG